MKDEATVQWLVVIELSINLVQRGAPRNLDKPKLP